MKPYQALQLLKLALRWFNRQNLSVQAATVLVALIAYAAWAYVHNHPAVAGRPHSAGHSSQGLPAPSSEGACADKLPYGAPIQARSPATDLGTLTIICRGGYVLGHSSITKTPLWVAEHLTRSAIGGKEPRTDNFTEDTQLPADGRSTLADFRAGGPGGSRCDRGHMAPAADFSQSAEQMSESFFLSNMVCQFPENNRGPWALLEGHVRMLTRQAPDVYVVTGPGFPSSGWQTMGPGRVGIPVQLYKVAFDSGSGRMSAWLLPNAEVPKDRWNDYCTSVDAVEKATGLTFFPALPAADRAALTAMRCVL